MTVEERLNQLGLRLPPPPQPLENYVEAVVTGNLVFVAGHLARRNDGTWITGKLGQDLTVDQGYEGAQYAALGVLATLKASLGTLEQVKRVVRLMCMVNSAPDFTEQHKVANGASDIFVEVFGDGGRPARAAVGMAALPFNACCELETVVEIA